ncbi:MAG: thioredoxin family protein [Clostridium sp.]|uniref:thioredoxin family protein n=1 Tax=Clostridium sp. TaxID=1506 RepID=UPI002FC66D0D
MKNLMGISYKKFLEDATEEQIEMINRGEILNTLSKEAREKIKKVKNNSRILVFSETRCGDAATAIPLLLKMNELNDKIDIEFFKYEENKEYLNKYIKETKIPTIVKVDSECNILGEYIEFPKEIKDRLKNEEREIVINEFRSGKYSKKIEEDIIKLILL